MERGKVSNALVSITMHFIIFYLLVDFNRVVLKTVPGSTEPEVDQLDLSPEADQNLYGNVGSGLVAPAAPRPDYINASYISVSHMKLGYGYCWCGSNESLLAA